MNNKVSEYKQYLFVIKELVSREIKRKYARSYLGILWSVLNPLMTMAVMSMIFTTIFKRSIENFPIYYLTGSILWGFFSNATNTTMSVLVDNRNLLLKVKISKNVLVLSRIYTALVNFAYTCIAYVLMLIVFRIKLSFTMLLFPVIVFFVLLFATGIGYILAIVYVFFADIKYLYSVLLTIWMYLSAIFYPVSGLSDMMKKIVTMNPVYNYIACARQCMMNGQMPMLDQWIGMVVWGVGVFVIGYFIFHKSQNEVMQRI